jgi:hypothetical protein
LVRIDGHNIELGLMQEKIKLTPTGLATPSLQDYTSLQHTRRGDEAYLGLSDLLQELSTFWLTQKDCQEG